MTSGYKIGRRASLLGQLIFSRHVDRSHFNYHLFDMGQADMPQFGACHVIIPGFCPIVFVLSWEKELSNLLFFFSAEGRMQRWEDPETYGLCFLVSGTKLC